MQYAKNTGVSTEKSKAEIERMIIRHGATGFVSGWQGNQAMIEFIYKNKKIRFVLTLPEIEKFRMTPARRNRRTDAEIS